MKTLYAVSHSGAGRVDVLQTVDQRFSVSARLWKAGTADPDFSYVLLLTRFASTESRHSFGYFVVVVDGEGTLWQMAVGEDKDVVCRSVRDRMRENQVDLEQGGERLSTDVADQDRAAVITADSGSVRLRAKAYPHAHVEKESVLCLRLELDDFGAVQLAISDVGRVLAMASGQRDRQAYQRISHEMARRGFALEGQDVR